MTEISLNVHDIAENSVRANASLVYITIDINENDDLLTVIISDNGCGMSNEQIQKVCDPFFTTRKTRKVGLGIPFFKMAAECTGGTFSISSTLNVGTETRASFGLTHIDRMPLGDINCTIYQLITFNTHMDFVYTYRFNDREFVLDTRQFREILDGVPLDDPEVSAYIRNYLDENKKEIDNGKII